MNQTEIIKLLTQFTEVALEREKADILESKLILSRLDLLDKRLANVIALLNLPESEEKSMVLKNMENLPGLSELHEQAATMISERESRLELTKARVAQFLDGFITIQDQPQPESN